MVQEKDPPTEMIEGHKLRVISIQQITPSRTNPRQTFDDIDSLASSIRMNGLLCPLLVRHIAAHEYEIIDGERRFKALKKLNAERVICYIVEVKDGILDKQVVANLQRREVHPLEEAEAMEELYKDKGSLQHVSAILGKSIDYVTRRWYLLKLIPKAKKAFKDGALTIGHADLIARLMPEQQQTILNFAIGEQYFEGKTIPKRVTVDELRVHIQNMYYLDLKRAPWDMADAKLVPKAGSCDACPLRKKNNAGLFDTSEEGDLCLSAECFRRKLRAWVSMKQKEVKEKKGVELVLLNNEYYSSRSTDIVAFKDVLTKSNWDESKPGDKCKETIPGMMVMGVKGKVGRIVKICSDKFCKTHHPVAKKSAQSKMSPDERKADERKEFVKNRKRNLIVQRLMLGIVAKSANEPLTKFQEELMLDTVIDYAGIDIPSLEPGLRALKIKEGTIEDKRALCLFALADNSHSNRFGMMLKDAKVNVKQITKQLTKDLQNAAKCKGCKCTALLPCVGGCEETSPTIERICSNCIVNIKKEESKE